MNRVRSVECGVRSGGLRPAGVATRVAAGRCGPLAECRESGGRHEDLRNRGVSVECGVWS